MLSSFYSWAYRNLPKKVYRVLRKPYTFYRNYFVIETHIYRTGVSRGKWADHSQRLSKVMRKAFLDFVEEELIYFPITEGDGDNYDYEDILEELEWQEEHNGFPQAVNTYKYLKKRRPELVKLEEKTLEKGYGDIEFKDGGLSLGEENKYMRDFHRKVEKHLHEMDQKYLHHIVDLIPYMLT